MIARRSARTLLAPLLAALLAACSGGFGRPPKGGEVSLTADQSAALARVGARVSGWIVWSSSRFGNHDLLLKKTDGTGQRRLTRGTRVDWYPRFDAAGKRVLFCRSKQGWVSERDANRPFKWDQYVIAVDGSGLRRVASDASWGTWSGPQRILFSRGTKVLSLDLSTNKEALLADSAAEQALDGALMQNPHLSPDGRYLAVTLRGARRETGVFDLKQKTWAKTGEGCQVNWFPSGERVYWVNPSGNGGSEVFAAPVKDGRLAREPSYEALRFVDIPGRRSHEYFPQLDRGGKWLVWAATRRGHDHDIADYEIYIWQVGAPAEQATRVTFNSGNDRWPDIHIPAQ